MQQPARPGLPSDRARSTVAAHELPIAGPYALVVSRLSAEKGIDVAIDACRIAGIALVVAGEGPELQALRARAGGAEVRFTGRVDDAALARLRAGAALALCPSRSAETFGLAAAEAMAAGLPVAGSRVGALPELLEPRYLAEPGDAGALARAIETLAGDREAGGRARERVLALCAPAVVGRGLADIYDGRADGRAA
jgi:glycosyltransferase involved in cell wall biosynthesis